MRRTDTAAERNLLHAPRGHRLSTYGRPRALAIAGPSAGNSFLDPVRNPNATKAVFRRLIKTFLFAWYKCIQRIEGISHMLRYANLHFDINIDSISLSNRIVCFRQLCPYVGVRYCYRNNTCIFYFRQHASYNKQTDKRTSRQRADKRKANTS